MLSCDLVDFVPLCSSYINCLLTLCIIETMDLLMAQSLNHSAAHLPHKHTQRQSVDKRWVTVGFSVAFLFKGFPVIFLTKLTARAHAFQLRPQIVLKHDDTQLITVRDINHRSHTLSYIRNYVCQSYADIH